MRLRAAVLALILAATAAEGQQSISTMSSGDTTLGWKVGRLRVSDSLHVPGKLVAASIGYAAGSGGTVTQATSKATGVTLNKLSGQITMNGAALAAAAEVSFVVTNSLVASTDVPMCAIQSIGTAGSYFVTTSAVANGSFTVSIGNVSTGSLSQALVLNCIVIKGVTS